MILSILKWFWLLIKASVFRKVAYQLSFTKESTGKWYVDFPNWPLSHDMLEMVAGADDMLDLLNDGSNHIQLEVSLKPIDGIKLTKVHSALTRGAFYTAEGIVGWERLGTIRRKQLYLCPVTLTVLGHYPRYIYFKHLHTHEK